jgi:hypothetical protein
MSKVFNDGTTIVPNRALKAHVLFNAVVETAGVAG